MSSGPYRQMTPFWLCRSIRTLEAFFWRDNYFNSQRPEALLSYQFSPEQVQRSHGTGREEEWNDSSTGVEGESGIEGHYSTSGNSACCVVRRTGHSLRHRYK
uniref:Uncharacterized protein n=2 Tax=Enterobacteriaceae TaxID=543 RepID=A0A2L0W1V4_CITFR|nr:Hypothetical protein [Citrobacter freundii]